MIVKEISKEELEKNYKKRIEVTVNNVKECVKYLEKNKILYEVISEEQVNIFDNINISEFIVALSKKNCIVNKIQEKEETLENYYMNLIGGGNND